MHERPFLRGRVKGVRWYDWTALAVASAGEGPEVQIRRLVHLVQKLGLSCVDSLPLIRSRPALKISSCLNNIGNCFKKVSPLLFADPDLDAWLDMHVSA